MNAADVWARSTLRAASPATWALVRVLAPADGYRDFARVYAYFRVADDVVDAPGRDPAAVADWVADERAWLVAAAAEGGPGRRALALALADRPSLRGPVEGMWEALAFDAARGTGPLSAADVDAQIVRVARSWLGAFAACFDVVPDPDLEGLVVAATATHQLRDLEVDRALGYCNVPAEVLAALGADPADRRALAPWLAERAAALRPRFAAGLAAARALPTWRARFALLALGRRYARLLDTLVPPGAP